MCRRRLWLLYYGNDEAKLHLNQAQFCVHLTGGVFVVHFKICQIQPSMELSENESAYWVSSFLLDTVEVFEFPVRFPHFSGRIV